LDAAFGVSSDMNFLAGGSNFPYMFKFELIEGAPARGRPHYFSPVENAPGINAFGVRRSIRPHLCIMEKTLLSPFEQ
jgi:hypothetical protein